MRLRWIATRCRATRIFSSPIPATHGERVRAIAAARREAITWRRTYRTDTPAAYWSYLQRYPRGPHAADARRRLHSDRAAGAAAGVRTHRLRRAAAAAGRIHLCRSSGAGLQRSRIRFFAAAAAPVYYLPPPPRDFVILEPPPPPIGLFILPQPLFVPIPVYVRAPVYVAPPPNNIIFANIHNTAVINNVINRPPPACAAAAPGRTFAPSPWDAPPRRRWRRGRAVRRRRCRPRSRKGDADPAGQTAGTAECLDQSCREDRLARHGAGRKAERTAAGRCAGRAAFDTAPAEDQCAAGSGRQRRATPASECCGIARRGQSECQARAASRSPRRCYRREARDRDHCSRRSSWPAKGSQPRHPAPPRRQGPPQRLPRNLNCSLSCGEPRRRLQYMRQGPRHRR